MKYIVRQGECIASIANAHGFLPNTLWDLKENRALRKLRENPNILFPGDEVEIPKLREKEEPLTVKQRNRFLVKNIPASLKIQINESGKPRANAAYVLTIDNVKNTGVTDGEGYVKISLNPGAVKAVIEFEQSDDWHCDRYELLLRQLDPIDTIYGVQARLKNLGFYPGELDGEESKIFEGAIMAFRMSSGLEEEGGIDDAFQQALKQAHGS